MLLDRDSVADITSDPLIVTSRIAHACGLLWAACPGSIPSSYCSCSKHIGHIDQHVSHGYYWTDADGNWVVKAGSMPSSFQQWSDDYFDRCSRLGIDPKGRGPSPIWSDKRISWRVLDRIALISVRGLRSEFYIGSTDFRISGSGTIEDMKELTRITEHAVGRRPCMVRLSVRWPLPKLTRA